MDKAVGRRDKNTRRARVRVLALLENPRRYRVRVLALLENPRRDRVLDPALLEKPHRERVLDRWFEDRDSSVDILVLVPRSRTFSDFARCLQIPHFLGIFRGGGRGLYKNTSFSSSRKPSNSIERSR
jgi:hypothetical protein